MDDFVDSRDLYAEYLVFRGFRVAVAIDGADAVRKASELLPALVLMDLSMPGLDGWDATRQLKSEPRTAAIPVVALTAHAFADFGTRAKQAGCDDVITKPCFPEELVLRVRAILKRPHLRRTRK